MTRLIRLIRIEGQTRKSVEYQFADFVAAYTTNDSNAKQNATELAKRLIANQGAT
jgi:hypothetical protein